MDEILVRYPLITSSFLIMLSLAIGSLLNVIIYRLPLMLTREWKTHCHNLLNLPLHPVKKVNLFYPRSFCPRCENTIPFWHNIPLLSYILLRGRCHKCQQSILFRYPLVEAVTAILSFLALNTFGIELPFVFALLFIWLLIPLFFIDLQCQLLPDNLTLILLWLGLIANTHALFTPLSNAVLSAAAAYLSLWLIMKLFYLVTGKVGMGNGDFKLFAAFGAWFGWAQLPFILFAASLTGAVVGAVYLKIAKKTKETPIPFGPFLCCSGLISLFYGQTILHYYIKFLVQI